MFKHGHDTFIFLAGKWDAENLSDATWIILCPGPLCASHHNPSHPAPWLRPWRAVITGPDASVLDARAPTPLQRHVPGMAKEPAAPPPGASLVFTGRPGSRPSQVPSHCRRRWLFPCLKNLPTDEIFSDVAFPSLEPTPRPYLRWGQVQGTGPLQCFLEHGCKAPVFTEEKKRRRCPTTSELVLRTSPYLLWPSSGPRARRQPHRWWLGQPGESRAREGACTVPS